MTIAGYYVPWTIIWVWLFVFALALFPLGLLPQSWVQQTPEIADQVLQALAQLEPATVQDAMAQPKPTISDEDRRLATAVATALGKTTVRWLHVILAAVGAMTFTLLRRGWKKNASLNASVNVLLLCALLGLSACVTLQRRDDFMVEQLEQTIQNRRADHGRWLKLVQSLTVHVTEDKDKEALKRALAALDGLNEDELVRLHEVLAYERAKKD